MRFVITGATGFIGLQFTKTVLAGGHSVFAVCRRGSESEKRLPENPRLTVVYCEMSEYGTLSENIPGADIFVHFAWKGTTVSDRSKTDIQRENVGYAMDAIAAAFKMGCSLFVEAGSQAEYGIANGKITEDTACNPFSEYGKAKLTIKEQGFLCAGKLGIKYLHLRIFSVFGENDHPHTLIMHLLSQMQAGKPVDLSECAQKWNYLYVQDAARQIFLLSQEAYNDTKITQEVFNIASEDTRLLKEFVERIKKLLGSASTLNYGAFHPKEIVTLDPDVTKVKKYIGFIASHSFDEAVRLTMLNKCK